MLITDDHMIASAGGWRQASPHPPALGLRAGRRSGDWYVVTIHLATDDEAMTLCGGRLSHLLGKALPSPFEAEANEAITAL
jgi:hypothetical protein